MASNLTRRTTFAALLAGTAAGGTLWLQRRTRNMETSSVLVLTAAAEAFIVLPIESGHYQDYFQWRFQRLPEARDLYLRFVAAVEVGARAMGIDFLLAPLPTRTQLLTHLATDVPAVLEVRREALRLFAQTDAYLHLGYEAWPGTARGFEGLAMLPPARR